MRRPASARTLYRALADLGVAPKLDAQQRPDGPKRTDTALLLGVLLAKTKLDAAIRADPVQEPPRGLTRLLAGYCSAVPSPPTKPACASSAFAWSAAPSKPHSTTTPASCPWPPETPPWPLPASSTPTGSPAPAPAPQRSAPASTPPPNH
ncbi:hypothetical protein ACFY04_13930 [Streptomyces sp. NPDC001549]|uniref:hypothetical protein n=1 Tax=Streptomyces sp. NPDC001549 TaxID=3364586 RepID=UPI0036B218FA